MNIPSFLEKAKKIPTFYICTALFLITFICYGNTLGNGLFFDDEQFIYKNVYVQNFSFVDFFTKNVDAGAGVVSNYYRPLLLITYGFEHLFFGNLPFIYHLNSFLLHAIAVILLFLLLKKIFENMFIAGISSLLFAIHPIQTEAVSYVSGRGDLLSAVFMFATLLLFLRNKKKSYIASYFFFIAALLSKETAIITPVLLILIELTITKSIRKTFKKIGIYIPYFVITFVYIVLRITILNFQNTLNFYSAQTFYSQNILVRLFTFLSILPQYFGMLLFPKELYIERDPSIVTTITNNSVIGSLFIIIAFFLYAIKAFQKKNSVFFFIFSWFFICFFLSSGIIVPINGIMYEHFLYLPSVGLFFLISYLLYLLVRKTTNFFIFCSILGTMILIFILLISRTIVRNTDWHDPITFYTKTLQYNSHSARIHNNLAMSFAENNQQDLAIHEYKKAIALQDTYYQTHYNLANSYLTIGNINDAEKEYKKSLQMDPFFPNSYIALAKMYKETQKKKQLDELSKTLDQKSKENQYYLFLRDQVTTIKNTQL